MSKPLTDEQRDVLEVSDLNHDMIDNPFGAALRRLDYLERKVGAADKVVEAARRRLEWDSNADDGYSEAIETALHVYDAVTE